MGTPPSDSPTNGSAHQDGAALSPKASVDVSPEVVERNLPVPVCGDAPPEAGEAHFPNPEDSVDHRYVKGTFYLEERHDLILEETRMTLRRKGHRRVDKSALVREAIELLAEKYHTAE